MAAIPGSVRVAGFIAPTDSTDTYAVTDEQYNRGGYRSVASIAERDAITVARRKVGMLVYVIDTDQYFTLKNGITNSGWVEWAVTTGGSGDTPGVFSKLNGEPAPLLKGMPVYINIADPDRVMRARATTFEMSSVAGLILNDVGIPTGGSARIVSRGLVEKTTLAWDFLTGGTGGLQAGRDYFLRADSFSGGLTHIVPTESGGYVVKLGRALTSTVIDVNMEPPIQL